MGELSGTGEASFADHSEPVVAEDKPKGGFRVTEEMRQQEEELRKLLGIGDDEGDRGERFRDPDSMTPAEKRRKVPEGKDYALEARELNKLLLRRAMEQAQSSLN